MMRFLLIMLILWMLGSYLLWKIQSDAKGTVVEVGVRDRLIALFWLPMLLLCGAWNLLTWAYDRGRCI